MRKAIKKNLIAGVPSAAAKRSKQSRSLCDACVRAKSHRHPRRLRRKKNKKTSLPQSDLQTSVPDLVEDSDEDSDEYDESAIFRGYNRTDVPVGQPRDIAQAQPVSNSISMLFTDVKGPMTPAGTKGEVYAQSFIEGDTKFLRRYYFKNRSECVKNLRHLLENVLSAEGTRLLAYCSDGAPELISRECVKLLAENGSKFLYSPPYTPILNSVVERNHRTTFESCHAMINESGLPKILWVYAAEYSTYIFNCLPTDTSSGYMSPIQARYGLIPDVSRLRRFGCICYCNIPEQTRDKGFVDKAHRCYFLGIDVTTQSYICWVISSNQEKISAHLVFDEVTALKHQPNSLMLTVAAESRNPKDFEYLIGMVY